MLLHDEPRLFQFQCPLLNGINVIVKLVVVVPLYLPFRQPVQSELAE